MISFQRNSLVYYQGTSGVIRETALPVPLLLNNIKTPLIPTEYRTIKRGYMYKHFFINFRGVPPGSRFEVGHLKYVVKYMDAALQR